MLQIVVLRKKTNHIKPRPILEPQMYVSIIQPMSKAPQSLALALALEPVQNSTDLT
jgi:hypothetical protein